MSKNISTIGPGLAFSDPLSINQEFKNMNYIILGKFQNARVLIKDKSAKPVASDLCVRYELPNLHFDLFIYVLLVIGVVALKIWIGLQDVTKTIFFDDVHILDIEAQTQTGQTTIETAHEV